VRNHHVQRWVPPGYAAQSLPSLPAVRNRGLQTLIYAICIRIWPCVLPANFDFFEKLSGVHVCTDVLYRVRPWWQGIFPFSQNSNANSSLPFIFLRRKLVVYWRKFIGHGEIACECLQNPSLAVANMHRLDLSFPLNWAHMLCFQLLGCINSNTEE